MVRYDGATALTSLARLAQEEGSILHQHKISLEVGRTHNPNKNPTVENAIREAEKEILRHKPESRTLTEEYLVVIAKSMNKCLSRIFRE